MEYYDDIPEWIKEVTPEPLNDEQVWSLGEAREIAYRLNFLKGSYVGFSVRVQELEEQVEIARDYQRELDAQTIEDLIVESHLDSTDGYSWKQEIFETIDGLAEVIRRG